MSALKFNLIYPGSRLDRKPPALVAAFLAGIRDGADAAPWRDEFQTGSATPSATLNYERGRIAAIVGPKAAPLDALNIALKTKAIPTPGRWRGVEPSAVSSLKLPRLSDGPGALSRDSISPSIPPAKPTASGGRVTPSSHTAANLSEAP